ncbi:hypothetical protein PLEOSDRAFT_1110129 [Pleurotus ostreatus PC15]|uniref:Uncharacterized protein n=1 Tax=Pleurotus ostreatus (strain PC15) TaxID=1137138 RepID=A0A067N2D3_PLEO1|nr:hypothetical protein PLEOSDRAFT_1110129 [Pleurotus ostreatus PC15]
MTVPSYDHDLDTDFHLFLSTDDGSKPVTSMQISPEPHAFVAVGEVGGCTKVYECESPFNVIASLSPAPSSDLPCEPKSLAWNPSDPTELHVGFSNGDISTHRFYRTKDHDEFQCTSTVIQRDTTDEKQEGPVNHLALSWDGSIMGAIIHQRPIVFHRDSNGAVVKTTSIDCGSCTPWRLAFYQRRNFDRMIIAMHNSSDYKTGVIAIRVPAPEDGSNDKYNMLWKIETRQDFILSFAISPDQSRFAIIYAHGGLEVYSISSAFIAACIAWDPPSDDDNFPVDVCFIQNNSLVIGHSRRRRLVLANIDGMDIMTTVVDLRRAGRQRGRIVFASICHIVTYSCSTRALSRLDAATSSQGEILVIMGDGHPRASKGDIIFLTTKKMPPQEAAPAPAVASAPAPGPLITPTTPGHTSTSAPTPVPDPAPAAPTPALAPVPDPAPVPIPDPARASGPYPAPASGPAAGHTQVSTLTPDPSPAPASPLPPAAAPSVVGPKGAFSSVGEGSLVAPNTPTARSLTYAPPLVPPMNLDLNSVPIDIDSVHGEGAAASEADTFDSSSSSPTDVPRAAPIVSLKTTIILGVLLAVYSAIQFTQETTETATVHVYSVEAPPKPAAYPTITTTVTETATIVSLPAASTSFVTKTATVTSTVMGADTSTLTTTVFTTETATLTVRAKTHDTTTLYSAASRIGAILYTIIFVLICIVLPLGGLALDRPDAKEAIYGCARQVWGSLGETHPNIQNFLVVLSVFLRRHWNKFIGPGDNDDNGDGDRDLGKAVGPIFMPGNAQLD